MYSKNKNKSYKTTRKRQISHFSPNLFNNIIIHCTVIFSVSVCRKFFYMFCDSSFSIIAQHEDHCTFLCINVSWHLYFVRMHVYHHVYVVYYIILFSFCFLWLFFLLMWRHEIMFSGYFPEAMHVYSTIKFLYCLKGSKNIR